MNVHQLLQIFSINKSINKHKAITKDLSEFCMEKILTKDEANFFAKQVKKDRNLWKKKNILMSILGTASYLEGQKGGYNFYRKEYMKTNKLLKQRYSKLYDKILEYVKKRVGDESNVKFRFALPGFHIFKCNSIFSLPVASVHKDLQYRYIDFDEPVDIDLDKTGSFTLCLELPKTGGGLYVFEDEKVKVNYRPGYIVCHNGKTNHMIAPSPVSDSKKLEYRITLQFHSLYDKLSNTWYLYW
jgi:hypothetical protein